MVAFLVILAVVALGVGGYFLFRAHQADMLPDSAVPKPLLVMTDPEPVKEPLVILDPFTGDPLRKEGAETIFVPLRAIDEDGSRQFLRLRVNRSTARDYHKFGPKFFRSSASDLRGQGYHCHYEENSILSDIELRVLYELMLGEDYEEHYHERYDELEAYYEDDPILFGNEAAIRTFENDMIECEEVSDEDIISEQEIDAQYESVSSASVAIADEPTTAEIDEDSDDEDTLDMTGDEDLTDKDS